MQGKIEDNQIEDDGYGWSWAVKVPLISMWLIIASSKFVMDYLASDAAERGHEEAAFLMGICGMLGLTAAIVSFFAAAFVLMVVPGNNSPSWMKARPK